MQTDPTHAFLGLSKRGSGLDELSNTKERARRFDTFTMLGSASGTH